MAYWALIPAAYQLVAILAAVAFLFRRAPSCEDLPPVSILKPTPAGQLPPREAIDSHQQQDYPEHQLVFNDLPEIETPNRKVGKLMLLARAAEHEVWIVNDADIRVPPDYVRAVVSTLQQPGVGLVTCLFRGRGDSMASNFEALAIAIDFMPSVLVARLGGIREFGLGATLAFRKRDLERIGGFEAIADYIADDYQLAKRIAELGTRVELAPAIVESTLHGGWREVWRHQIRWARTVRCSRPGAYLGLPVAHAGLWALICGNLPVAAGLILIRVLMAWVGGVTVVNSPIARRWFWLAPIWDLFAFAVWIQGWTGNTVEWQGRKLRLDRSGRIGS